MFFEILWHDLRGCEFRVIENINISDVAGGVVCSFQQMFRYNYDSIHVFILIYCFVIYESHAHVILLFLYCNFNLLYF